MDTCKNLIKSFYVLIKFSKIIIAPSAELSSQRCLINLSLVLNIKSASENIFKNYETTLIKCLNLKE